MIGSFNLQNIVGSDRPPWNGIKEKDMNNVITVIKKTNPRIVSLSPHDSSDWSIEQFRNAFWDKYQDLRVRKEILI